MKFRHADLENFRANPKAFVAQMGTAKHFGQSMYRYWQLAVRAFHKEKLDVAEAVDRLEGYLHSHFAKSKANEKRCEKFAVQLTDYIAAFESLGVVLIEAQPQLSMQLPGGRFLTGELARVDLVPAGSGYSVYVFQRGDGDWRRELRFPLIQTHFASEFKCSPQEVCVGVYSLDRGQHEQKSYSAKALAEAKIEIESLLRRIK